MTTLGRVGLLERQFTVHLFSLPKMCRLACGYLKETWMRVLQLILKPQHIAVGALFCAVATPANAEYWCSAVALRNTHYVETPEPLIRKGQKVEFTTDNGAELCQHGGYCAKRRDFKLLDCDAHLNPIRSKADPASVRHSDIEDTLLNMGLCSACADNAAAWYLRKPMSPTGRLVKSALEGNPVAKRKLQGDIPNFPY